MSELRKQIEAAREEYRKLRYPGDLAEEVCVPARPTAWRLRAGIALASAAGLAAMAAIALMRPPAREGSDREPMTDMVAEAQVTDLTIPALPEMPFALTAYDSSSPEANFALPGLPAFPSMDEALSATDSESEEETGEAL